MSQLYPMFLVIGMLWSSSSGLKWLSLATSGTLPLYHHNDCSQLRGLSRKQVRICRRNLQVMDYVRFGAEIAIKECQHQFRNQRWNCSFIDPNMIFSSSVLQGTRETAFIHALSSAAMVHSVTNACSRGSLDYCGCDHTVSGASKQDFEWAGCSDNVVYGASFSQKFADAQERLKGKHLVKGLVNVHNNKAGRTVVSSQMKTHCKCHGVSGSCELKTCWRAMPNFRNTGDALKNKFNNAAKVVQIREGEQMTLTPVNVELPHYTDKDLVYLSPSPDFCEADLGTGSLGTRGRKCDKDGTGMNGCGSLCCGRGYVTKQRTVIDSCQCKFYWCCEVKCKKCERIIEEHFCR